MFVPSSSPLHKRWRRNKTNEENTSYSKWSRFLYLPAIAYDAVSDLIHNWVAQRPDFRSALRVVKMVLNTQCIYIYGLQCGFMHKKSKETLKQSKSQNLLWKFGFRAQKWPKIAQKTDHSIAICPNIFHRYGIYWMSPGESSCPDCSEYVRQRGGYGAFYE